MIVEKMVQGVVAGAVEGVVAVSSVTPTYSGFGIRVAALGCALGTSFGVAGNRTIAQEMGQIFAVDMFLRFPVLVYKKIELQQSCFQKNNQKTGSAPAKQPPLPCRGQR